MADDRLQGVSAVEKGPRCPLLPGVYLPLGGREGRRTAMGRSRGRAGLGGWVGQCLVLDALAAVSRPAP